MRNIEYDLSPERMERVWRRYRARWERTEEVEREERLQERKEEFRRRVDAKRERIADMTEEEREDFLFKLRQRTLHLQPDAPEPRDSANQGDKSSVGEEKRRVKEKELEKEMKRQQQEEREKLEENRRVDNISHQQFSEWIDPGEPEKPKHRPSSREFHSDPYYDGLDPHRNASADFGSFVRRTREGLDRRAARQEDSAHLRSTRHGILGRRGRTAGEWILVGILLSLAVLVYLDYVDRRALDRTE
jgi:hypothetical protein